MGEFEKTGIAAGAAGMGVTVSQFEFDSDDQSAAANQLGRDLRGGGRFAAADQELRELWKQAACSALQVVVTRNGCPPQGELAQDWTYSAGLAADALVLEYQKRFAAAARIPFMPASQAASWPAPEPGRVVNTGVDTVRQGNTRVWSERGLEYVDEFARDRLACVSWGEIEKMRFMHTPARAYHPRFYDVMGLHYQDVNGTWKLVEWGEIERMQKTECPPAAPEPVVLGKWQHASDEQLDIIEANECKAPAGLTTRRFRRCFNEIRRLTDLLKAPR